MNIDSLSQGTSGTVSGYIALAIPLTLVTIWIMIGLHEAWHVKNENEQPTFWDRWLWPVRHAREFTAGIRQMYKHPT